ncbi:hypothetical protein [Nocardioides zeae]
MTADLPPLARALARTDLADAWYRWCDAARDWAAEAATTYDEDSLLTERGSYAPLATGDFLRAFEEAGADQVSRGSTFPGPRHRSFTVVVERGATRCSLAVQLGRGLNSLECDLRVTVDDELVGGPDRLHALARTLRLARGEDVPDPAAPYPRPIIGSRSQLEVVAREVVGLLSAVAREWRA